MLISFVYCAKMLLFFFRAHYTVSLKDIEVGREVLDIPTSLFESKSSKKAIIDSGTTLVYLPSKAYNALMNKVTSAIY